MQTHFTPDQLATPAMRESEQILRTCVHCGLCSATCPTYALLGDELDSPRGRIYLIKNMLEAGRAAGEHEVHHIDRCLSCLGCMTACPSGVHYAHLVDHAREWIEETYRRPWRERLLRATLAFILPRPGLFRTALTLGRLAHPFAQWLPKPLATMLRLLPERTPPSSTLTTSAHHAAHGVTRMRVALLTGCVQSVLGPRANDATIRLLTRHGCEVIITGGTGCCGALPHHMGKTAEAKAWARRNIDAWAKEIERRGLDAIIVTASGCGTVMKDYGHMFRDDPVYAEKAAQIAALVRDPVEVMAELGLQPPVVRRNPKVAYHAACSLQHGQKITTLPKELLAQAGFTVSDIPEGHMCCGSAGTYNILQPEIARQLQARKRANIVGVAPDVVAAGNIGCAMQIAGGDTNLTVVHTIELLDWATGGPKPPALTGFD